jgi:hypothetical protein
MEQNPELIAPDNGMGFLSDDGGLNYNRCHCTFLGTRSPPAFRTNSAQSGAISKSRISISGAAKRT